MSTTMETVIPKLVLRTGPLEGIDSASLDEFVNKIPAELFASVGVIAPVPARFPDNNLAPNTAILELNDRVLDTISLMPGINPAGIIGLLEQNAAEWVVPEVVDFLLIKLSSRLPALVDTALASFTTHNIGITLRSRLKNGESIKNLAGILEEMLAESV
jgi:hypothetical protein